MSFISQSSFVSVNLKLWSLLLLISSGALLFASAGAGGVDERLQAQLRTAIADDDLAGAKAAIAAGADINVEGLYPGTFWQFNTLLMYAARANLSDLERVGLLEFMTKLPGLRLNQQNSLVGNTALMYAADMPHHTLDSVVIAGVKTNRRYFNSGCATKPVEILLKAGADVNLKNRDGNTALGCALLSNCPYEDPDDHTTKDDRLPVIQLLLAHGANPTCAGLSERAERYIQECVTSAASERGYRLPATVAAILDYRQARASLPLPFHRPTTITALLDCPSLPTDSAIVVAPPALPDDCQRQRNKRRLSLENVTSPLDQR